MLIIDLSQCIVELKIYRKLPHIYYAASTNTNEGELQSLLHPSISFEIIHVDHFGPIVESSKDLKYIISKWL